MPTTDSNLTGTFIANTYQKLLQVDSQYGSIGTTPTTLQGSDITGGKYTLLNGLGQAQPALLIQDTSSNNNGGLFIQNTVVDPSSAWGIQVENSNDSSNTPGLNFWRISPSTNAGNYKLFLKNTGTTFVGFTANLPDNISGYNLYVKDGIYVGMPGSGYKSGSFGGFIDYGQHAIPKYDSPGRDVICSGWFYTNNIVPGGNSGMQTGQISLMWQKIGNVVNCSGTILFNNTGSYDSSSVFWLPYYPKTINPSSWDSTYDNSILELRGWSGWELNKDTGNLINWNTSNPGQVRVAGINYNAGIANKGADVMAHIGTWGGGRGAEYKNYNGNSYSFPNSFTGGKIYHVFFTYYLNPNP